MPVGEDTSRVSTAVEAAITAPTWAGGHPGTARGR